MSHVASDFVGDLHETTLAVTGFHGTKQCKVYKGTIKWQIEDDNGVIHDILISGSYFIPNGKHRLISPQHWAQSVHGSSNTSCLTLHDRTILKWNDGRATKTVPIDTQNVFTFDLAPGYQRFSAFCLQAKYDPVKNDQSPELVFGQKVPDKERTRYTAADFFPDMDELERNEPTSSINLNGTTSPSPSNDVRITRATLDKQRREPSAEMLRMHYKFGHVNFSRLRAMARNGLLPKSLDAS
jgi:hypothetical protein